MLVQGHKHGTFVGDGMVCAGLCYVRKDPLISIFSHIGMGRRGRNRMGRGGGNGLGGRTPLTSNEHANA